MTLYGGTLFLEKEAEGVVSLLLYIMILFLNFVYFSLWCCVMLGQFQKYRLVRKVLPFFMKISCFEGIGEEITGSLNTKVQQPAAEVEIHPEE